MRYLALLGGCVVVLCSLQAHADQQTSDDFRFGIGMGVDLPADLTEPNLAVASFRYKNMEFQPFVGLTNDKAESKVDDGVISSNDTDSAKTTAVGTVFKYDYSRRGKMDFQLIASLRYSDSTSTANPEGPNNRSTEKAKEIAASYGLGLQWWFASNFSLMATATNPVYTKSSTRTTEEQVVGDDLVSEENERAYGLVWDPNIAFAVITWF
jgi:hypothetical protein